VPRVLRFHPEAVAEAERSRDWYAQRSPRAAQGFLDELSKAFASIQGSPEAWQAHLHGTRGSRSGGTHSSSCFVLRTRVCSSLRWLTPNANPATGEIG
jgi:plasmid stabilization system protein ParE